MLCANPDIVVERGDKLVYCAGALADAYAELGGEVYYAGKPHRPIYDLALAEVNRARKARTLGGGCRARSRAGDRRFGAHGPEGRASTSASIACSSPPASMPRSSATATIRTRRRSGKMFAAAGKVPKAVTRRLMW